MPGDRRSSGERKSSSEIDGVPELNEVIIPLAQAVVSKDDEALVFSISVPPNVAKYSEFQFRCGDAEELQKWHSALVAACISDLLSTSVQGVQSALQSLKLGPSSVSCESSDTVAIDLKSRSLPAKCDVRSASVAFASGLTNRQESSVRVSPLNRPKSTSDVPVALPSASSLR